MTRSEHLLRVRMRLDACARLHIARGERVNSYRALGTVGYLAGLTLATVLGARLGLPAVDRAIVAIAPPVSFLLAVKVSELVFGRERIVFYEKALFALGVTSLALWLAGGRVATGLDVAALGIGTFLVFGRIGCFMVGCCHGRPAWWGVRYRPEHGRAGFPSRWVGRPVFPIQLIEVVLSLSLVTAALLVPHRPGGAAMLYLSGYGIGRFVLELWRGDSDRPLWKGVTEAQWTAFTIALGIAALRRGTAELAIAAALTLATVALLLSRRRLLFARYWLASPWHVDEVDHLLRVLDAHGPGGAATTTFGLRLSGHNLPGAERVRDYVLSFSPHPLSVAVVRSLARYLDVDALHVLPGRTAGLVHLVVRR